MKIRQIHLAYDGDDSELDPGQRRWSFCRTFDVAKVGDRRTATPDLVTCRRCLRALRLERPSGVPYIPPFDLTPRS